MFRYNRNIYIFLLYFIDLRTYYSHIFKSKKPLKTHFNHSISFLLFSLQFMAQFRSFDLFSKQQFFENNDDY